MPNPKIDPDKLRVATKRLKRDALLILLGRAFEQIPKTRLAGVIKDVIDLDKVTATKDSGTKLLSEIKRFQEDSLGGEYYESFDVNSRNFMDKSEGTENWIAECERLFNRCTAEENRSDPKLTREAMGILFDLLRHIDGGYDDVVFFADEGGSWQVGVDWDKVLPVWFLCLSEAENPEEYAGQVLGIIEDFVDYDKKKYLALARKSATPEQKKSLRGA